MTDPSSAPEDTTAQQITGTWLPDHQGELSACTRGKIRTKTAASTRRRSVTKQCSRRRLMRWNHTAWQVELMIKQRTSGSTTRILVDPDVNSW